MALELTATRMLSRSSSTQATRRASHGDRSEEGGAGCSRLAGVASPVGSSARIAAVPRSDCGTWTRNPSPALTGYTNSDSFAAGVSRRTVTMFQRKPWVDTSSKPGRDLCRNNKSRVARLGPWFEQEMVEAVGVEPTSEERVPEASTCVAFVSGHRPCALDEGLPRRRQFRFDDPDEVRNGPHRSIHLSGALARVVNRAHGQDVAVN